jgi:choline dehydrogenase-like flavoprotein
MGGFHGPVSYAVRTPGFGLEHKRAVRERFGRIVTLFGSAEQEPRSENRISLSDQPDSDGVPKVSVRTRFSERDIRAVEAMFRDCEALAEASGAVEILNRYSTYDRSNASQVAGSCRMGREPESSVTDPWGRVHGIDNLYICDASVLPGQGAGDALSLTIQALAWRTAERLARRQSTKPG